MEKRSFTVVDATMIRGRHSLSLSLRCYSFLLPGPPLYRSLPLHFRLTTENRIENREIVRFFYFSFSSFRSIRRKEFENNFLWFAKGLTWRLGEKSNFEMGVVLLEGFRRRRRLANPVTPRYTHIPSLLSLELVSGDLDNG